MEEEKETKIQTMMRLAFNVIVSFVIVFFGLRLLYNAFNIYFSSPAELTFEIKEGESCIGLMNSMGFGEFRGSGLGNECSVKVYSFRASFECLAFINLRSKEDAKACKYYVKTRSGDVTVYGGQLKKIQELNNL